ncbi:DUF1330 domain-containing protein [Methylobacterium radiotolerans]|uniref:DUF1330 domain-containing protein n=1 Tax=Methylobacterium radiotolerans TaxID=31998 RepID=UPI0038D24513
MSAYFIVRADVRDPAAYQAYACRSPGVLAMFGGRHIARGGRTLTFEGPPETRRIVIAEFPDFASAERCYRSAAYQAIIPHRRDCADFDFILVDGCAPDPTASGPL